MFCLSRISHFDITAAELTSGLELSLRPALSRLDQRWPRAYIRMIPYKMTGTPNLQFGTSGPQALSRAARRRARLRRTAILQSCTATSGLLCSIAADSQLEFQEDCRAGLDQVMSEPQAKETTEKLLAALRQPSRLRAEAEPFVPSVSSTLVSSDVSVPSRKQLREEQSSEVLPAVSVPLKEYVQFSAKFCLSPLLVECVADLVAALSSVEEMHGLGQHLLAPTWIPSTMTQRDSVAINACEDLGSTRQSSASASQDLSTSAAASRASQDLSAAALAVGAGLNDMASATVISASQDPAASAVATSASQEISATVSASAYEDSSDVAIRTGEEVPLSDLLWGDDSIHEEFNSALGQYLAPQNFPPVDGDNAVHDYLPSYIRHLTSQEHLWSTQSLDAGYRAAMLEYESADLSGSDCVSEVYSAASSTCADLGSTQQNFAAISACEDSGLLQQHPAAISAGENSDSTQRDCDASAPLEKLPLAIKKYSFQFSRREGSPLQLFVHAPDDRADDELFDVGPRAHCFLCRYCFRHFACPQVHMFSQTVCGFVEAHGCTEQLPIEYMCYQCWLSGEVPYDEEPT